MMLQALSSEEEPRGERESPFKATSPSLGLSLGLGRGGFTAAPLPSLTRKPSDTRAAAARPADGFRSALVEIMHQAELRPRGGELPALPRPAGDEDEKGSHQFNFYINHGIDTEHIAPMEEAWLHNMLELLSEQLKRGTQDTIDQLCDETRDDYMMSVKKAIVDFVLRSAQGHADAGADYTHMPAELRQVPLPWAAAFLSHRVFLERNLHMCSPALLAALGLWESTIASTRLVRAGSFTSRPGPVELSVFAKLAAVHCDDAQNILLKVNFESI